MAQRRSYRREKPQDRRPMAQPAKAERDPDWESKDHLDPERSAHRSRSGAATDAEGQDETGAIDQTVTDKGYTERR